MQTLPNPEACVDAVIARVGKRLLLGAPLALGNPNHLLNAFERRLGAEHNVEERPRIEGNLPAVVESAFSEINGIIRRPSRLVGHRFRTVPEYPEFSWKEAVINAVAHRDYTVEGRTTEIWFFDDRFEVDSPGGLVPDVRLDALLRLERIHISRNPRTVRALVDLGIVRDQGEGIPRMFAEMDGSFLPAPHIEASEKSFRLTLRNTPTLTADDRAFVARLGDGELNDLEFRALLEAHRAGRIDNARMRQISGLDTLGASALLRRLRDRGLLELHLAGAASYYVLGSGIRAKGGRAGKLGGGVRGSTARVAARVTARVTARVAGRTRAAFGGQARWRVTADHTERAFEKAIEHDLLASGFVKGNPDDFDSALALIPKDVFAFIQASQPALWSQLKKDHGTNVEQGLLDALIKHLATQGLLTVLRHGFKFFGKTVRTAFFRPSHGLNPDVVKQYDANILTITRQVPCNPDSNETVDMMVTVNGLPVATLELKNSLTGQTVAHARKQYLERDQRLPLFQWKRGALVHFAVDTDEVYMTTRLSGNKTFFLPFNRGDHGGAGNPSVEGESYKIGYLWRQALERHSLLDILARFMHLAVEERKDSTGKLRTVETMIFPRYHQLDVVRQLETAAKVEGAGNHYLIQHSAGSGKSNSIAWTAHRLASLHDKDDKKIFDSVVVITDRRVLDKQLQDTIYQFEHKSGVVARIDKHSDQLAKALSDGTPIVITTLQKFPFVTEKIGALPSRRYALIVDEAHSSQSGEAARTLREVLSGKSAQDTKDRAFEGVRDAEVPYVPAPQAGDDTEEIEETYEDEIVRVMGSRGKQPNLSFFAFTATPKGKTLEVFGRPGPEGKPIPFHTYSMRQAIEEGFILDVLRNYTTYKTYYKLIQAKADDPKVKKKEAVRALARYMSLHPHNISQKVEVIVEHFRQNVQHKLQGRAKAMVVTRSRLHAVRYKLAMDAFIREQKYEGLAALVAFSGTVLDPEIAKEFTEPGMNQGISETELPDKFAGDDYQVLIVANKYQTGFDQPLLCAMYVDRKLSGVQAVQTLSRLNRMAAGKTDTFVLDFANEAAEIQAAFQPYYEQTTVAEVADTFQLDQLRHELDQPQIWWDSELEAFAKVFYRPANKLRDTEHAEILKHLQPAVDRFKAWQDEQPREEWRAKLQAYVRLYSFLSQIMGYEDRDLEVRYSFGRLLLKRLPRDEHARFELDGEVDLHSYRLQRVMETDIALIKGEPGQVKSPTDVGTGSKADEEVHLHEIIDIINDRFGTDFTKADELLFDQIIEDGKANETVRQRAEANDFDNFALSVKEQITGLMIDRMDKNEAIVSKFLDEDEFKALVTEHIARRIYEGLKKAG